MRPISPGNSILFAVMALGSAGCGDSWYGSGPGAEAAVTTPSGVQAGDIEVVYTLTGDIPKTDVSVAFSENGSSFRKASEGAGGDGTDDLSVSPTGSLHTFVWDSAADLDGGRASSVIIRVDPDDGRSDTTAGIAVHNGRYLLGVENREAGRVRLYRLDAVEGESRFLRSYDTGGTSPYDAMFQSGFFLVAHPDSKNVAVFQLDETAETLTAVEGSPFAGGGVGAKYLASDGTRVFVSNTGSETLSVLDFDDENGLLATNPHSGTSAPGCRSLLVRSNRLYVASETAGSILFFDIANDGELFANGASPVTTGGLGSPVAMVSAGTRLYAANAASSSLCGFNFQGDGSLSPIGGSPFAISSTGVEGLTRNQNKLFAVNGAGADLLALTFDAFGAVTEDPGSPFSLTGPAFGVQSGASVAVAATTTSTDLELWTISAAGAITPSASSPVNTGVEILRIALSD